MRKPSLLGFLAFANLATAGLGKYIDGENGKLAISNITPVLFLLAAIPLFIARRETVKISILGFLLMFNAFGWLSFLVFMFQYGWAPNFPVLGFQEVELMFVLLLVWYARVNPDKFPTVARRGILCSVAISIWYGAQALKAGNVFVLAYGMDDKSQAAVLFCCQAFILIRYFGGTLDFLVAGALILMSFTTLSRLPVIFVPVIMIALAKRSKVGFAIAAGLSVVVIGVILSLGDNITKLFKVFDRLASIDTVASDGATSAHLLLLETALRMKFMDVETFFLGSGAGNFSKALTSFPISLRELDSVDPQLINDARVGRAPMHSLPFSFLLDYSIVIFCTLGFLLLRAVRYLLRSGNHVELMFFASLFSASMFYSLHNKAYLFVLCTTIFVLMQSGSDERQIAGTAKKERPLRFAPGYRAEGGEY